MNNYRIEYRERIFYTDPWMDVTPGTKFKDLNTEAFSFRINGTHQYHRADTKGFKESYDKVMSWIMITTQ